MGTSPSFFEAAKIFKNKLTLFLVFDWMFFISISLISFFAYSKMRGYISELESYSSQIALAQQALQQGEGNVDGLIAPLSGLAQETTIFFSFIVPLLFFVAWYVFECPTFLLAAQQKFFREKKVWLNFLVINAAFFAILSLALNKMADLIYAFFLVNPSRNTAAYIALLSLLTLFAAYIAFVANSSVTKKDFFKKIVPLAFKKISHFILPFTLTTTLFFIVAISIFISFISFVSTRSFKVLAAGLIISITFTAIFSFSKTLFVTKVAKEKI